MIALRVEAQTGRGREHRIPFDEQIASIHPGIDAHERKALDDGSGAISLLHTQLIGSPKDRDALRMRRDQSEDRNLVDDRRDLLGRNLASVEAIAVFDRQDAGKLLAFRAVGPTRRIDAHMLERA